MCACAHLPQHDKMAASLPCNHVDVAHFRESLGGGFSLGGPVCAAIGHIRLLRQGFLRVRQMSRVLRGWWGSLIEEVFQSGRDTTWMRSQCLLGRLL
jgi:hypothetical protein